MEVETIYIYAVLIIIIIIIIMHFELKLNCDVTCSTSNVTLRNASSPFVTKKQCALCNGGLH